MTLTERLEAARKFTADAANIKDWKIRNKHNRAMRQLARELTASGKGYMIASVRELSEKYGKLCHYDVNAPEADEKAIWAIWAPIRSNGKILFTAM